VQEIKLSRDKNVIVIYIPSSAGVVQIWMIVCDVVTYECSKSGYIWAQEEPQLRLQIVNLFV
jgi:hypothetical protein